MTEQATAPPADEILATDDDIIPQTGAAPAATDTARKNVHKTTWEDQNIRTYEFDLYKGRLNVTDRIGILVPNEIVYGRTHFVDKVGYFMCQSDWKTVGNQDTCTRIAPCCEKLEAPDKRFACLIIHYGTNPQGALVQPFSFTLKLWRFSASKFVELRDHNAEFPFDKHDLKMSCTEANYQRFNTHACKEKLCETENFRKKYGAEVDQWVKGALPKLTTQVAKSFTAKELLEKLGMAATPATVVQTASVEDIKDLLKD